ncbi:MAG: prolyl oligopeptidase family serine peptidase [Nannocystaceae bacterium]
MCAAGLTVISPAVRGSGGFGKDFAALNDRDLGGAEIRDLFAVARWAAAELGLEGWQIGVYGGSHGGYATMRALTYEAAPDRFDFGFGLAHAGFSDILTFFAATNIPDWVILESGDPKVAADAAKMRERSPLTHVERLEAPLLLTHGDADARVPVAESRQLADKAEALGRPVTYVEFAGQGHHIEGLARLVEFYQANFDLLQAVGAGRGASAAPAPAPAG